MREFSRTDVDGAEVRIMSTGERTGWNMVLRTARLGYGPAVLCQALTHEADRCERAVDSLTRRGFHGLAEVSLDAALVLDHAAEHVVAWA
jgi:hypothetical protein